MITYLGKNQKVTKGLGQSREGDNILGQNGEKLQKVWDRLVKRCQKVEVDIKGGKMTSLWYFN